VKSIGSARLASGATGACRKFTDELIVAAERIGMKVESIITGTADALVVYLPGDYGINLIFAGNTGIAKRPVSDKGNEVNNAFSARQCSQGVRILTSFVIDESSYEYADVAAAAIYNTIMTVKAEDSNQLNVNSFMVDGKIVTLSVSTKPDAYRAYIRSISPFGFQERDDIGFLVGFPKADCPHGDRFNIAPETHVILFAVSAYTQFIRTENSAYTMGNHVQKSIRPLVHITGIHSQNPSMVLLPPAIIIAAKAFLTHQAWKRPYLLINGKEHSNCGNLGINVDPVTSARSTVESESAFQAEEALNLVCDEPILALDITEGRYGIPGLEWILGTTDARGIRVNLADVLAKYYGSLVQTKDKNIPVVAGMPFTEYTGSITLDNQVMDSRNADYLRMFKKMGDYNAVAPLLSQPNDPAMRLQQLSEFYIPTKSLYSTTSIIFTRECVEFMARLCPSFEIDITNDSRFNHTFNGMDMASGVGGINLGGSMAGQGGIPFGGGYRSAYSRF
jgi:hypothetical protein